MSTVVYFYRAVSYKYRYPTLDLVVPIRYVSWSRDYYIYFRPTYVWEFLVSSPSYLMPGEDVLKEFSENSKIKKWDI